MGLVFKCEDKVDQCGVTESSWYGRGVEGPEGCQYC